MSVAQTLIIKTGSIILHKRFKCKVLQINNKTVKVKRVNSGLVLEIPIGQMPGWAVAS